MSAYLRKDLEGFVSLTWMNVNTSVLHLRYSNTTETLHDGVIVCSTIGIVCLTGRDRLPSITCLGIGKFEFLWINRIAGFFKQNFLLIENKLDLSCL
jgi:hypothetical protein